MNDFVTVDTTCDESKNIVDVSDCQYDTPKEKRHLEEHRVVGILVCRQLYCRLFLSQGSLFLLLFQERWILLSYEVSLSFWKSFVISVGILGVLIQKQRSDLLIGCNNKKSMRTPNHGEAD
jgi:hypothetical protein